MTTLKDEFLAERRAEIEEVAKMNGAKGAFGRLIRRLDTEHVNQWIDDEIKRGTSRGDMLAGFMDFLVNTSLPVFVGRPAIDILIVYQGAAQCIADVVTGHAELEIFAEHRHTGKAHLMTAEGLAKHGFPE